MQPEREHIEAALQIERNVPKHLQALYMECMNNLPMSKRTTDQELRDGCILTHHVYAVCAESTQKDP